MRRFFFELKEGILIAFRAVSAHKMRSVLTTLGIIIGIVSVTAMFTTINGIERGFNDSMAMLGNNILHVQKWPWADNSDNWWEMINRPRIREDLAETISRKSKYAVAAAPVAATGRSIQYKDQSLAGVFIQASTPAYAQIHEINLDAGRFYTDVDHRSARNVCVIGIDVAEGLFPNENPLGKRVRIAGNLFEVIGVLSKQGKFFGLFSFDTQVQMPYGTFKKIFGTTWRDISIEVKAPSEEMMPLMEDEVRGLVRVARGQDALEPDNFAINKQEAFRQQFDAMKIVIYGVGIFLTALSLLVGGIGVMNIMFVSVKERTKEIGIRKALGAPRRAILGQFLVEAVVVCMLGGLVGIMFSALVTQAINAFFTAHLSVGTVMLAFGICVGIGILFGLLPAWTASRSNPIEALRYE